MANMSKNNHAEGLKTTETSTDKSAGAGRGRFFVWIIALFALLIAVVAFSFTMGRYHVSIGDVITVLLQGEDAIEIVGYNAFVVVYRERILRIASAVVIGAALSLSGAVYQNIFGNPLVSPDIMGASSGAALGACVGILLGTNLYGTQAFALVGGLIAVAATFFIGKAAARGRDSVISYVLSGIVIGALLKAGLSLTKYVADPYDQLEAITYWLMGSLSSIDWMALSVVSVIVVIASSIILFNSYKLNLLSFSDDEARAMGVNVRVFRPLMIAMATLLCASCVAISGIIGWVGLMIPHIARILVGPDSRKMLPITLLLGAIFLLLMDDVSRTWLAMEIPIGILTGAIGAPVFIGLLIKGRNGWR